MKATAPTQTLRTEIRSPAATGVVRPLRRSHKRKLMVVLVLTVLACTSIPPDAAAQTAAEPVEFDLQGLFAEDSHEDNLNVLAVRGDISTQEDSGEKWLVLKSENNASNRIVLAVPDELANSGYIVTFEFFIEGSGPFGVAIGNDSSPPHLSFGVVVINSILNGPLTLALKNNETYEGIEPGWSREAWHEFALTVNTPDSTLSTPDQPLNPMPFAVSNGIAGAPNTLNLAVVSDVGLEVRIRNFSIQPRDK